MWAYALVGGQVGLQHIGPHPRATSSLPQLFGNLCTHQVGLMQSQVDVALHHPQHYGTMFVPSPGDILDPAHTMFFPRPLIFRLSKWTDYAGPGETDARKFVRAVFRRRDELGTIPRRFVDQRDQHLGNVVDDFKSWADGVVTAWGGIPSTDPRLDPRILAALNTI